MPKKKTQREAATGYDTASRLRMEFSVPDAGEELIVIVWAGEQDLPLYGWQVRDSEARNKYTFGELTLSPGATIQLHAGGDAAQDSASDLYWDGGEDRWHDGDVLHLLDPTGLVQAQCLCGTAPTRGATAATKKPAVTKKAAANPATSRKRPGAKKRAAKRAKRTTVTRAVAAYDTQGAALRVGGPDAKFDALGEANADELVSITWDGAKPLALQGWQVHYQDTGHRYTFGDVTLAPGSTISLHADGDPANDSPTDIYGGHSSAIQSDDRNLVHILDPNGVVQVEYVFTRASAVAEASVGADRVTTVSLGGHNYDVPPSDAGERATRAIWTYVAIAAGIGVVPIPFFDLAALTSLQLLMINGLGEIYNVKFTEGIGRKAVISLIGASLPLSSLRFGAFSLLRIIPVVGPVVSGLTVPILAGATTYAVGKVFNLHFAAGGTFLSFDPQRYKQQFRREFALGLKIARQEQQQT